MPGNRPNMVRRLQRLVADYDSLEFDELCEKAEDGLNPRRLNNLEDNFTLNEILEARYGRLYFDNKNRPDLYIKRYARQIIRQHDEDPGNVFKQIYCHIPIYVKNENGRKFTLRVVRTLRGPLVDPVDEHFGNINSGNERIRERIANSKRDPRRAAREMDSEIARIEAKQDAADRSRGRRRNRRSRY